MGIHGGRVILGIGNHLAGRQHDGDTCQGMFAGYLAPEIQGFSVDGVEIFPDLCFQETCSSFQV